jgi:hypothetical protein
MHYVRLASQSYHYFTLEIKIKRVYIYHMLLLVDKGYLGQFSSQSGIFFLLEQMKHSVVFVSENDCKFMLYYS